jgi:hypothetical protein
MVSDWTGNGLVMFCASSARRISGAMPRSANVDRVAYFSSGRAPEGAG